MSIRKTPTIILYPAGKKDSPIEFENDERTEITIMEFVKTNLELKFYINQFDYYYCIGLKEKKRICEKENY